MRENIGIYRGKRIDTGAWKEGYLLGLHDKLTGKDLFFIVDEVGEYHRVEPETVGEYTGLKDKDDRGIFEGDIVIDNIFYGMGEHFNPGELIVIGNIHDNPELMEKFT